MTRRHWPLFAAGVVLVALGVLLPRDWYDALPTQPGVTLPPLRGVTLLQICFVIEGLALAALGAVGWRFVAGEAAVSSMAGSPDRSDDLDRGHARLLLAVVLAIGLGLRLFRVGSDLWLDEITPLLDYSSFSLFELVTTYLSSNNHLLNSILVRVSTSLFGSSELAVRLPALTFGTATIGAVYWMTRMAASRRVALGAALLLAVSYHHIFFSQNARGYTSYVFFSLLSTGFLARGLASDRLRDWGFYCLTMFLNFASLLHSGFVFAAHILVGMVVVALVHRRGEPVAPLIRRLVAVFALTTLLGFQLYATVIPQAYAVLRVVYSSASSGFAFLSMEFVREVVRGVTEGFGPGLLLGALPFLGVAAFGFLLFVRARWTLAVGLVLPLVLTAAFLIVRSLTVSPRFFILGVPVAMISVAMGIFGVAEWAVKLRGLSPTVSQRIGVGLVGLAAAASAGALPAYYRSPKQANRAVTEYLVETREANDLIGAVYTTIWGMRYYGPRLGLEEGRDFVAIRSDEDFDRVMATRGDRQVTLLTTFSRAQGMRFPELQARIEADWSVVTRFRGTVHDATILVWKERGG